MDVDVLRVPALAALQQFFKEMRISADEAQCLTPNKVVRRYLAETTVLKAPVGSQRTGQFWVSMFATRSKFCNKAQQCDLYKRFYKEVIAQLGLTLNPANVPDPGEGCVCPWQLMALFYMSGDTLASIKLAVGYLNLQLTSKQAIILPLNVSGFCNRLKNDTDTPDKVTDYMIDMADITLNSDYCMVQGISMADISPSMYPRHHQQQQQQREQIIVNPGMSSRRRNPVGPTTWTQIEETLFQADDSWKLFKKAAGLPSGHPARWTIRVYLSLLPNPPFTLLHAHFVNKIMPYCDVATLAVMPEVIEFGLACGADNSWSAAKLVTHLIWLYDPMASQQEDPALRAYLAKYPRLTTAFVCNLILIE